MTTEANKALLRRYKVDILNSRDLQALDQVAAAGYLDHAAFPGQAAGLEGLKQRIATLFEALDPQWTIHDTIAEGDMVVLRWSHAGTHRGEFLGVPPTGKTFVLRGIDMYRVRNGKIAEHWNVVDLLGFRQQVCSLCARPRRQRRSAQSRAAARQPALTHRGAMAAAAAATHGRVQWDSGHRKAGHDGRFGLLRLQDGRIAELWHLEDDLAALRQLGIIPSPG